LKFGNNQKSAGAKSGEYGGCSIAEMHFPVKAATLKAKNLTVRCCGEESTRDLSSQLSSPEPHDIDKPFQQLHVQCLINSGPLGYKFKMDDNPKKQINIVLILYFDNRSLFGLGIHRHLFISFLKLHLEISAV
jgi:hypothetical protein